MESQQLYKLRLNKNISRNIFDKQFENSITDIKVS